MKIYVLLLILGLALLLFSCQGGLNPEEAQKESVIKGNVIITSGFQSWPNPDSALEIRVVAFRKFPPADVLTEVLSGNAYYTDALPRFRDTIPYVLNINDPPDTLEYISCALRYGTIFQWKVIGVYTLDTLTRKPQTIFVPNGKTITDVNIYVDFYNLPEQPF